MIGKALFAVTGVLGLLMLIPSGDATTATATTPSRESALATSPELARFLESAVAPKARQKTPEQVIADVAAEPEPGSPTPVNGLKLPAAPSSTQVASLAPELGPREATTVRSPVNMRSGPSTGHTTLFVLQPDEPVTVVGRDGRWTKIQKADGTSGWVHGNFLGDADSVAEPQADKPIRQAKAEPQSEGMAVSAGGAIRLRAGPSSKSETIFRVEPGTPLRIAEQRDGWLRVVLPDGLSGWVRGRV